MKNNTSTNHENGNDANSLQLNAVGDLKNEIINLKIK